MEAHSEINQLMLGGGMLHARIEAELDRGGAEKG